MKSWEELNDEEKLTLWEARKSGIMTFLDMAVKLNILPEENKTSNGGSLHLSMCKELAK